MMLLPEKLPPLRDPSVPPNPQNRRVSKPKAHSTRLVHYVYYTTFSTEFQLGKSWFFGIIGISQTLIASGKPWFLASLVSVKPWCRYQRNPYSSPRRRWSGPNMGRSPLTTHAPPHLHEGLSPWRTLRMANAPAKRCSRGRCLI